MSTENENLAPDTDLDEIEFAGNYTIPEETFPDPVLDEAAAADDLLEGYVAPEAELSTQEANPRSVMLRTLLQQGVPALLVIGLAIPEVISIVLEELGETMPESLRVWLLAAAGIVTGLGVIASRIMALPGVNALLRKRFPALAPEDRPALTEGR